MSCWSRYIDSTFQPHEGLNCYVVSYVLHWTSSFGGHYVQALASLRIFWYEFYNIGRLWGCWQREYLQQYHSPNRASCLECISDGDNTLNMERKTPCLCSRRTVIVVCRQIVRVCCFFRTYDLEEKRNSISARFGANGRLSAEVELSSSNIVLLPRNTTQLLSWPPPGIFQDKIAQMIGYQMYSVPIISARVLISRCWLLQVEALIDVSPLSDPVVNRKRTHLNCRLCFPVHAWGDEVSFQLLVPFVKYRITCLPAGDLLMLPSAVAGQFLTALYEVQSMRYVAITHDLGTSTLLSSECVPGLCVPAVRCSLDHGPDFTITTTMSNEFPVENRPRLTCFCLFVCGIELWNPGISHLVVSLGAPTCRRKRAYFSGRQCDPVYGGLDCDTRLGYWEHMTIMLPSCLFWFASWHTYKVQPTQNYMKLAQDLLELYSSLLGPSDYEIHVASASGMVAMRSQSWTTTLQFSRNSSAERVGRIKHNQANTWGGLPFLSSARDQQ